MKTPHIPLLVCASLTLSCAASFATPLYTITDIKGSAFSFGHSINASGQITGFGKFSNKFQAFIYDGNGDNTARSIDTIGGISSHGNAINDAGHITGHLVAFDPEPNPYGYKRTSAFFFDGTTMQNIRTRFGGQSSEGIDINNQDIIVGDYLTSGSVHRPFLYDGGNYQNLGTLGSYFANVTAINNSGTYAGKALTEAGDMVAYMDTGTGKQALFSLSRIGTTQDLVVDINDSDQVTATISSAGFKHAAIYSNGELLDLGTLGGDRSVAQAINNVGQVVGFSQVETGDTRGFVYDAEGMHDLNDLIDPADPLAGRIHIYKVHDINDAGQMTGSMRVDGGPIHPFIATPDSYTPPPRPKGVTGLEGTYRLDSGAEFTTVRYLAAFLSENDTLPVGTRIGLGGISTTSDWNLVAVNDSGDYQLSSTANESRCMGTISWSEEAVLLNCDNLDAKQIWRVSAIDEQYRFQNQDTGECLSVPVHHTGSLVTSKVELKTCTQHTDQAFLLADTETLPIEVPADPREGINSFELTDGGLKIGWKDHRPGVVVSLEPTSSAQNWVVSAIPDGFELRTNTDSPLCLGIPPWSQTLPILNRCDGGFYQVWNFVNKDAQGNVALINIGRLAPLVRTGVANDQLRVTTALRSDPIWTVVPERE